MHRTVIVVCTGEVAGGVLLGAMLTGHIPGTTHGLMVGVTTGMEVGIRHGTIMLGVVHTIRGTVLTTTENITMLTAIKIGMA